MDTDGVFVVLAMTSSGLLIWFLARRIRAGELHLIAGYRGDEPVDEDRLARSMSRVASAVAALTVATGVAYPILSIGPDDQVAYWGGYTVALCLLAGYAQLASRAARDDTDA